MGATGAARKLASAAALGGGGLSVLGAGLYGVLVAEAKIARRLIGNATDVPPQATGWYGRGRPGPAIRIALLGDSSAAGYGAIVLPSVSPSRWGEAEKAVGDIKSL